MKPIHDPFDDLIAAALYGELSPAERTQFDSRRQTDAAAQAAYQEAQRMHDLLEKTYREAQPDPAFEQRMISGVRRKLQHRDKQRETAWESLVVLWNELKKRFTTRRPMWEYGLAFCTVGILVSFLLFAGGGVSTRGSRGNSYLALLGREKEYFTSTKVKKFGIQEGNTQVTADAFDLRSRDGNKNLADKSLREDPVGAAGAKSTSTLSFHAPSDALAGQAAPTAPSGEATAFSLSAPVVAAVPTSPVMTPSLVTQNGLKATIDAVSQASSPISPAATPTDSRKLIRDATLNLEVKSFPAAIDEITALTKEAGGYVDTSSSQRGGNGKLQGTIVVKVLPQNLDGFLIKLRDLGHLRNQSIQTQDVTKAYFDTQARLDNSRRMETQLQELLTHANGRVSDLLQVERELGRVRGEIEKMQGELKLYDFQVDFATVTMQVSEKDLNQTAAYLLKEQDDFALFAHDVEGTFQQARHTAEQFKAQILSANLNHNSGTNVSAELVVMVAPEQIEPFLEQVKALGRVDNFTRQTQRVAQDGGNSDQPADQTLTEKDKVQVHLSIRSDDESSLQQTNVSIRTKGIDEKAQQIKKDAAAAGVEVKASHFARQPDGSESAQIAFRLPSSKYGAFLDRLKTLGTVESLTVNRDDRPDQIHLDENAPVDIDLQLHNEPDLVPENHGFWATLRHTFAEGAAALLGSVRLIGVLLAFGAPWLLLTAVVAWIGRRIYVARRK